MDELKQIDRLVKPDEVFLVCDAMTGQDAVNSAKAFNDALDLNGVILTKLDGDARGGAALSIKEVTGVPIKFIGVGEKLERARGVPPERMAQRILGQGDLMGLVEKVAQVQSRGQRGGAREAAGEAGRRATSRSTTSASSSSRIQKMGMKDMIGRMPGMGEMIPEGEDPEVALKRIQGMIDSMTKEERGDPDIIDPSRRRRIAAGSGAEPHEVKQFLDQFDQVRTLMRQMASMSIWERIKMVTGMGKAGAFKPGTRDAQDEGRHRPPQERQGTGRGAEEEKEEAVGEWSRVSGPMVT